ncbi:MAG: aminoacyl-histidine dipeptidase [Candidatus Saccharicenans sp.]|jgi:dipeptidase D|nr:aminoacyl-histidine dipeptidase [Candidatus Saccharicenans sp.]MDH7493380.1 aminoacyl-histidine dipeptidase [Candidatus Saccharicenans sp.]
MSTDLTSLQPEKLWKHFSQILTIPHGSGNEKALASHILNLARSWGLEARQDKVGNVVVRKPASPGKENSVGVVLQAHLDMVCEKNSDVSHDFLKDPIQPRIDGDWVKASGTTLGADNGIGLAACLAVLEDRGLTRGPLECLFTVDEETGLTGAFKLGRDMLQGKLLLNLDSEDEGTFTIGCAGGADSEITLPLERKKKKATNLLLIKISSLLGGHSGLDINLGRGNALKLLSRVLALASEKYKLELVALNGGNKRNAIPREAWAVVAMEPKTRKSLLNFLKKEFETIKSEYRVTEPELAYDLRNSVDSDFPLTVESQNRLLRLILSLPHGVISMHPQIAGLVETSSNLAIVNTEPRQARIICNSRSSVLSALEATRLVIRSASQLAGARAVQPQGYPAWTPNLDSPLLANMVKIYRNLFQKEPEVKAVHAGLECGIIGEKYPGMDMISFGPTIKYPHSPDEKVSISSVEKFWQFLLEALNKLT